MSGETESSISAWTVDSLRTHVSEIIAEKDARITEHDRRYEERFKSQEKAITTAMEAYGTAVRLAADKNATEIAAVGKRLDDFLAERDLRYGERFEASQEAITVALAERDKALQAALAEREKAIQAAFDAQELAVKLALAGLREFYDTLLKERDERYRARFDASETAVVVALATVDKEFRKAETATEKRFESVNEFRAQQADIINTFARKAEVDARMAGLTEKIDACQAATLQLGGATLPRNEYDRAHTDLADKVIAVDKAMNEKLEAHTKAIESRIALLQSQVSNIEAITR